MEREFIGLGIGVLAIGEVKTLAIDRPVRLAIEALGGAGHDIIADRLVADEPAKIRAALAAWIAEPTIDVVVVLAGIGTEHAVGALAPLVTRRLTSFGDLIRLLTYKALGSSATLIDVEAAQCQSTFVFVLPASVEATRLLLDRLVIPQLDVRTRPRNLAVQLPRAGRPALQHLTEADILAEELVDAPAPRAREAMFAPPPLAPPLPARRPEPSGVMSWLADAPLPRSATVIVPSLEPAPRSSNRALIAAACTFVAAATALVVLLVMHGNARDAAELGDAVDGQRVAARATGGGPTPASAGPATPVSGSVASAVAGPRAPDARAPTSTRPASTRPESTRPEPTSRSSPPRARGVASNPPATSAAAPEADEPAAAPEAGVPVARAAPEPAARARAAPEATAPARAEPEPAAPEPATTALAAASDGCDEVSCVLERGNPACCARYKLAGGEARVISAPAAGLVDRLDRQMIQAGISPIKQAVSSCGRRHDGKGVVNLRVQVAPTGAVTSVTVRSAPGDALGACVADVVRTATFGKTGRGGSFGYPFMF